MQGEMGKVESKCPFSSTSGHYDSLDFADPVFHGNGAPHDVWKWMRKHRPVRWQSVPGKNGFWSVFKYEDVTRVLKNHLEFTSTKGTLLNILGAEDPAGGKQMAVTDPPKHTQLKLPIQKALKTKSITKHADTIRSEVKRMFLPALSGEIIDFASGMARISTATAGAVMELPKEDWPTLTKLTTMAIAPDDPEYILPGGAEATIKRAHRELFAYFQDIVTERKLLPGNDVVSLLLNIKVDGKSLDLGTIVSNCYSLLLGANVTTPHVPTAALLKLLETELYEDWYQHPECLHSGLEEALRWSSPASHFMRYATKDIVLRGETIRKGDAIVAWLGSANRDEEVFSNPDEFDIRRQPNRHIAFGFGPHYCVGHDVARQSLQIVFEEMLSGFSKFELVGEIEYLNSNFVGGMKHMRIMGYPSH